MVEDFSHQVFLLTVMVYTKVSLDLVISSRDWGYKLK